MFSTICKFSAYYMSKIKSLRGVDYYVSLHGHDVLKYEKQTTLEYELTKSVSIEIRVS